MITDAQIEAAAWRQADDPPCTDVPLIIEMSNGDLIAGCYLGSRSSGTWYVLRPHREPIAWNYASGIIPRRWRPQPVFLAPPEETR